MKYDIMNGDERALLQNFHGTILIFTHESEQTPNQFRSRLFVEDTKVFNFPTRVNEYCIEVARKLEINNQSSC